MAAVPALLSKRSDKSPTTPGTPPSTAQCTGTICLLQVRPLTCKRSGLSQSINQMSIDRSMQQVNSQMVYCLACSELQLLTTKALPLL